MKTMKKHIEKLNMVCRSWACYSIKSHYIETFSILYNAYRVFPGGKERQGRDADTSPHSSAVIKKE